MDKRNKTALAYLLIRGWRRRGGPCSPCRRPLPFRKSPLTVLAMVGYLLLAGKAKLPIVFGAAGLVLELILSGAQSGGAWVWLEPALRAVDLWLFWARRWCCCGCAGKGGQQNAACRRCAAGRLHRGAFSAARCHRRCRGLCGVQCRHALVRRQHDPRLQRRPRKKKADFPQIRSAIK